MTSQVHKIHLRPIAQPLPPTLRNAARRPLKKEMLIVFVELGSGEFGIGECWTAGIGNTTLINVIENSLQNAIEGKTCSEARDVLQEYLKESINADDTVLASGISGLDCALWDAEAKAARVPLCELLGGSIRSVYTYASGGLYDDKKGLPELARDVLGYVEMGFNAVKIKVAGIPIEEDIERVKTARQALGPDIRLMIDANAAYSSYEALEVSEGLLDQNIFWFEEPCAKGLEQLRQKCQLPICGYEREVGRQKFIDLVDPNLVDYVQFDLSMCGGITEGLEIMNAAKDRPVSLHGSSSVALFQTNLQFAAAFEAVESVEFHMVHQWPLAHIDGHDFSIEQGFIQLSDSSGNALNLQPNDLESL
jgi:L-alanine-DL-glutamate epimerase-like enolase superfamily enzyme